MYKFQSSTIKKNLCEIENMKKSVLFLATLSAFSNISHAESSAAKPHDDGSFTYHVEDGAFITLYGILDAGVATQNHSASISSSLPNQIYPFQATSSANVNHSVTGAISGGLSDSRVGLKGGIDLYEGAQAIFDVETGFSLTSGQLNDAAKTIAANPKGSYNSVNADSSINGQLFNRQAWFGIADKDLGTLTIGKQNNPMKDVVDSYNPVKSDTFSPLGESGAIGGGGGISEEARMENSVKYSNTANGFKATLAYQFGNNSGSSSTGSGYAINLGYENDAFGLQAVYNNFKDALKAVQSPTAGDIALQTFDTDSYLLAGKYKGVKDLTLSAGWEHINLKDPSDPTFNVSSIWGYTVTSVTAGLNPGVSQTENVYFIGGDYNFMPKLNLSLAYYDMKADNKTHTTNSAFDIKTFSTVLDYHFTKRVEGYLAATTNEFGGVANATNNERITAYGTGLRVKF